MVWVDIDFQGNHRSEEKYLCLNATTTTTTKNIRANFQANFVILFSKLKRKTWWICNPSTLFRGQIGWKRLWRMTWFCMKQSQDLENWWISTNWEFRGVPHFQGVGVLYWWSYFFSLLRDGRNIPPPLPQDPLPWLWLKFIVIAFLDRRELQSKEHAGFLVVWRH